MKKSIILLAAFVALTTASCKKDYVCSCTISSTVPGATAYAFDVNVKEAKKADAQRACVKMTGTNSGYTITQDCKLK